MTDQDDQGRRSHRIAVAQLVVLVAIAALLAPIAWVFLAP